MRAFHLLYSRKRNTTSMEIVTTMAPRVIPQIILKAMGVTQKKKINDQDQKEKCLSRKSQKIGAGAEKLKQTTDCLLDIKNLGPWNGAKKTVAKTLQVTSWQKLTRKKTRFEFGLIVFVNDPFVILEMD